jgi:uncharacterized protein YeaO (DUF488 family)
VSAQAHAGLRVKRVYEPPEAADGLRVLVDRLWPRGLSKDKARVDLWLKDVAPSDALRRRVHAGAVPGAAFARAYAEELEREPARSAALGLMAHIAAETVTLLYAARDQERNNAVVLQAWLAAGRAASDAKPARPPGRPAPPRQQPSSAGRRPRAKPR